MDKDEILDSIVHHEERAAKMRAEAEAAARKALQAEEQRKLQQTERDRVTRHAQADELETKVASLRELDSREMVIEHIRKMREEVPVPPEPEGYRSPEQQAQFEMEQKAGREAVARAEENERKYREIQQRADAEQRSREATTTPVHHPNPSQDEQYPTVKATLGKPKK